MMNTNVNQNRELLQIGYILNKTVLTLILTISMQM